jgi:uncharacterized membrane protein
VKERELERSDLTQPTESTMTRVISLLLVIGVSVSAAVLALGLILVILTGQTGYHDAITLALVLSPAGTVAFPRTIGGVIQGALELRPFAVIELGIILLVATPVFRVAASVLLFFLERDYLYTVITLLVLGLLIFSLFWVG